MNRLAAVCGVCLLGLLAVPAGAAGPAAPVRIEPGTYRQVDGVTKKRLEVGNQIVIIAGKAGRLGFSINAIRASDTNLGFIAGVVDTTLPATWTRTSSAGNCRLTFEAFPPHGLKVTQDSGFGDCGLGAGITATGSYELVAELPLSR